MTESYWILFCVFTGLIQSWKRTELASSWPLVEKYSTSGIRYLQYLLIKLNKLCWCQICKILLIGDSVESEPYSNKIDNFWHFLSWWRGHFLLVEYNVFSVCKVSMLRFMLADDRGHSEVLKGHLYSPCTPLATPCSHFTWMVVVTHEAHWMVVWTVFLVQKCYPCSQFRPCSSHTATLLEWWWWPMKHIEWWCGQCF